MRHLCETRPGLFSFCLELSETFVWADTFDLFPAPLAPCSLPHLSISLFWSPASAPGPDGPHAHSRFAKRRRDVRCCYVFPCMLRRPYSNCFLRRLNFQIRPNPHSEPMPTQETPESRASRRSAVRTISRLSSVLQSPDVLNKDCGAQILALRVQQLRQDSCIES